MKIVAKNQRALFDYDITERIEAGIILTGQEVKSVRQGHADLRGAYVSLATGKPVLKQAKIQPYRYASGLSGYDPGHDRELLLKKKETERLAAASGEKGMTVMPLEFRAGRTIKVLIGLGRGRRKYEKRERIKKREIEKNIREGGEW